MKQLLFLLLFPCLAMAQYPSNGNQKITLGEQTTADNLIWRGVASDTTKTVKTDTSAWIVLDTANSIMYHYDSSSVGRKWLRVGGSISSDMTGTLPVANGGTGSNTQNFVDLTNTQTIGGAKTFSAAATFSSTTTATKFIPTGTSASGNGMFLPAANSLGFSTNNTEQLRITTSNFELYLPRVRLGDEGSFEMNFNSATFVNFQLLASEKMRLKADGELIIGYGATDNGAYRLQVKDSVYVGGNVSASAYTTRSDFNLKDDILNLKYGLNDILQLQPVEYTYKSNGSKQLGFIAQDIGTILPEVVSFEESMSVNYQAIIPVLTKAIQEQQALIKALEQRIINLENK